MSRRATLLLAALLAATPLIGGCRGEDEPWLAHLKDEQADTSAIPDLSPPQPTSPGAPAPPVSGGLTGPDAQAEVDPGAPPPVTDAEPQQAAERDAPPEPGSTESTEKTDEDEPSGEPNERPSSSGRKASEQAAGADARTQLDERRRRQAAPAPKNRAERIAADKQSMLDLRTMVSIIEGCNSGRDSYAKCNTHGELGDPNILGLEIGRAAGQIAISASRRGFRVTTVSRSGARFTMARGPAGDRFRCIPGPAAGACPASRTWGW